MDLTGKVALVTGGAERVGRTFSLALAKAGADVVVNHWHTKEAAEATRTEIEKLGRRCLVIEADVSSLQQNNEMIAAIAETFGRLDILIHNASNFNNLPFEQFPEAMWDSSMNLNLKGPFFLSQAAAKLMKKNGFGRIIGMAGNSTCECWPDFIAHSLAKTGLVRLMEHLAVALSPDIQCFAVCPSTFLPASGGEYAPVVSKRGESICEDKRYYMDKGFKLHNGNPEEVAELVVFLAGCNNYMNGAVIHIDGGKHLI